MSTTTLLLILVFGLSIYLLLHYVTRQRSTGLDKKHFRQKWSEILRLTSTPHGLQLAIIEGDKIVDEALKRLRYGGKSMGERLVSAQAVFSDANALWSAHKLRNRLVHETDVKVTKPQVKRALQAFQQALRDLGAV